MPQMIPYYFVHQISVLFLALGFLMILTAKYILPTNLQLKLSRAFLTSI